MMTRQGIMVIVLLLLAGCATRKQATDERTALQVSDKVMANSERQLRKHEKATLGSIRLEHLNSSAEIIPVGTFRMSADSGYIGQAKRVVINQERRGFQQTALSMVATALDSAATVAAASEYTAIERDTAMGYQEVGISPPLKVPWWAWLCGAGVAFYLIWRLLVK